MPVELAIVESVTELETTVVEVVLESASAPGPAGPGVEPGGTVGQVLTKQSSTDFDTDWEDPTGGGGGAPDDATYLVTTTNGDLSAEVVVGATPGGELGGTWASPTVDATHSGSTHAAVQAAAEATAASALTTHTADTTAVHGITDTSVLETTTGAQTKVDTHVNDATAAHAASAVSVAPFGSIAATQVQAALEEIVSEAVVGAPTGADYLVGTANGGLSAEIVVGTSPGGELGGSWASPTVDATHSGSSHAGIQAAAEATAQSALDAHLNDTSDAHDASAISIADAGNDFTATTVEGALDELQGDHESDATALSNHISDATDAHDASAISVVDAGTFFTATDVEGVLAEIAPQLGGGGGGLFDAYALLRDEKSANTAGGTFTSGAWRTRTLNTEVDPSGIVSLASDQFTLQAGTYLIEASAPAYLVLRHKIKLRNITDSTDDAIGKSVFCFNTGVHEVATLVGRITIAGAKAFEIQHQCESTGTGNGFGVESNFGVTEIYTEVQIWRES